MQCVPLLRLPDLVWALFCIPFTDNKACAKSRQPRVVHLVNVVTDVGQRGEPPPGKPNVTTGPLLLTF